MKYLIHTIAFLLLLTTTACGDFFLFEDESDIWDGVSMRVLCDSTYVMEGDTMALNVAFIPMNPDDGSVYWLLPDTITAKVRDNKLIAKNAGELDLVAISNNGRISDTVRVTVFERWNTERLEYSNMHDMVIFAHITVDGEEWDSETQEVVAFVNGSPAGKAVEKEANGIKYALIRVFSYSDEYGGLISLRCYDRSRFRLFRIERDIEFNVSPTLGTLSNLYQVDLQPYWPMYKDDDADDYIDDIFNSEY